MYNEEEDIKLAKSVIKGLYRGIILPFDDSKSTEDEDCNLIVNLNIENSCCLSTRARVPCKIVFECVNVKDLINFDNYYIDNIEDDKNRNSTDSGDGIIENQNDNNILVNDFGTVEEFLNGSFEDEEEKKIKEKKEEKIKEIVKEINYYNENKKEKPKEENLEENIRVRKNSEISLADFQSEFGEIFGVRWKEITNEIKLKSNYRNFPSLQIKSFIAKANDDLRQESLTMQLIKCFSDIFKKADIPLKLKTYEIIITSANSGLIEFIPNTISIDALKKNRLWN